MGTEGFPAGAVVVGVDGSPKDARAVMWAAEEARHRGVGLHVVYAYPWTVAASEYGIEPSEEMLADAGRVTGAAQERVHEHFPDVPVTSQVVVEDPVVALVKASERGSVVVMGARGLGRLTSLLLGSVSHAVAAHAHGPVVVVREHGGVATGPVIVGLDPTPGAHEVLRFAVEHAAARGLRVRVVHAHPMPGMRVEPGDPRLELLLQEIVAEDHKAVVALVEELSADYPEVRVDVHEVHRGPVDALVAEADRASLVVVGSRSRSRLAALRLGSVGRGVLYRAPIVAIVRVAQAAQS